MQIHRITYVFLGLVIIVGTISITTQRGKVQTPAARKNESEEKLKQREEEARKHFPTAGFDEQEPSDPQKQAAFRKRKVRHNKGGLVYRNPDPNTGGGAILPEGQFDFPALPTGLSDVIVLGEVLDAQAHLSEDKSNVYSEFTIRIDNIFKSRGDLPGQITVERIGGWVRYPDGRKLFYQYGMANMPRVGGKYLLFLKHIPQSEDFTILTGYEFEPTGVSPLDPSGQFEAYRGYSETTFLIDLNSALASPSPSGVR
jgi:hypothetical protein